MLNFNDWQHSGYIYRPMSNAVMPMLLDHRATLFYLALFCGAGDKLRAPHILVTCSTTELLSSCYSMASLHTLSVTERSLCVAHTASSTVPEETEETHLWYLHHMVLAPVQ